MKGRGLPLEFGTIDGESGLPIKSRKISLETKPSDVGL